MSDSTHPANPHIIRTHGQNRPFLALSEAYFAPPSLVTSVSRRLILPAEIQHCFRILFSLVHIHSESLDFVGNKLKDAGSLAQVGLSASFSPRPTTAAFSILLSRKFQGFKQVSFESIELINNWHVRLRILLTYEFVHGRIQRTLAAPPTSFIESYCSLILVLHGPPASSTHSMSGSQTAKKGDLRKSARALSLWGDVGDPECEGETKRTYVEQLQVSPRSSVVRDDRMHNPGSYATNGPFELNERYTARNSLLRWHDSLELH
ncbi:hypothetical protein Hypma_009487 [Hypsizygus marmoreus]|uniref:Uncharacterized protein n=1 Tax=Hypsizygus marmoreus TaxID=39966 RepID=A0A369JNV8_HYPMA|nr:hypothetical protein Hypma_009487 [Hypsizygus marmoreus]